MNTTTFRRGLASVAMAAAGLAVTACGADIEPPAQDIGGSTPSTVTPRDGIEVAPGSNPRRCASTPFEARAERRSLCTS